MDSDYATPKFTALTQEIFGDGGICDSTEEERTQEVFLFPLRALLTSQPRRVTKIVLNGSFALKTDDQIWKNLAFIEKIWPSKCRAQTHTCGR